MVNFLMIQPLMNLNIVRSFYDIAGNAALALDLGEPAVDFFRSVVVVWEEKAREHSRGCASASGIVANSPQQDEQKAGITGATP